MEAAGARRLEPTVLAAHFWVTCQNGLVADTAEGKARKTKYVDNGWPTTDPDDHAVSELVTDRTGALSPFGELTFPLPSSELPYLHPVTVVNR